MQKIGYKTCLTKSLIKESTDIETHNNIVREFLSTMVYGGLQIKRGEKYILVEQDETHTSFYAEKRCYNHYDIQKKEIDYAHHTYNVYTLTYDTKHTTCRFDIEQKSFYDVKDYQTEILNKMDGVILYKEIGVYCRKLVDDLGLIKYDVTPKTNKTSSTAPQTNSNFDNELSKAIYAKSTRLKVIDVEQSSDNIGITNPNFSKSKGVQFKVQDMIGDNNFRNINATKQKAESSLINWQKSQYSNNEENINTVACDVIHTALENATSNKASQNIELTKEGLGSKYNLDMSQIDNHELNKLLSVYPPELLSPLVFLSMDSSIKWGREGSKTSKEILNYIFGDDSVFKNGLISFDTSVGGELIDSEVAIKTKGGYKKIGISTKGGLNGQGAQASLISIFRLLFDKETREYNSKTNKFKVRGHIFLNNINSLYNADNLEEAITSFVKSNCSEYGIEMFENSPTEVALILLFGGLEPKNHLPMIGKIVEKGKLFDMNVQLNGKHHPITEFCNIVNTNFNVTNVVMEILNKQKYDFAQINSLPKMTQSTFKYDWSVQYPAHFDGNVKLEKRGEGVGFHIIG